MSDVTPGRARAVLQRDPLLGPLLGPVLREHPDVDVVVLPPVPAAHADPTPAEATRLAIRRVEEAAERLGAAVPGDWSWGDPVWWNCGDRAAHRYVVRGGLRGLARDDARATIARVEAVAGVLVDDDLRIRLTPQPTAVDLTIEGALVHLAPETFAELTGELRERLWRRRRSGGAR